MITAKTKTLILLYHFWHTFLLNPVKVRKSFYNISTYRAELFKATPGVSTAIWERNDDELYTTGQVRGNVRHWDDGRQLTEEVGELLLWRSLLLLSRNAWKLLRFTRGSYEPSLLFSMKYRKKWWFYIILLVPKSETQGFDSWLTSSLRIECNFPLARSDAKMVSETKFWFYATNEQNEWWIAKE